MTKIKITILLMLFIIVTGFKAENSSIEGLSIKFEKVSEDYMRPGDPIPLMPRIPIEAAEGMKFVKLKLTLKNEGEKDCIFDFADVYISSEQDSLYRFVKLQAYFIDTKTKIKPKKEIYRIALFEFPDKLEPKELFIEDKRYKIIEEK
ncbi:hypothetical protein [Flavobacterium hydatis]|uniref:DUF4352 domain-containing protein n=1 Tax=Flavobacterium hydatis TaxID=991 RepID=A0A085ZCR6_FLAHY|nr:hypothetical protein [Flavobacterium hydatis]KFF02230.1 hypothetical protein IW20_25280 [Flavobacterium hydatis]OXA84580.1 hypothetical protein B0A62_25095 [Flavobacterium hydatis]